MWSKQKLETHLSVLWTNLLLLKNTSLIEQNCQKKQVWSRVIKLVHKLKKKGILKLLFWNAVKDLNIPEYQNAGHRADIFLYPVLKTIVKHRIHPSVIAIESSIMDLHLIFHVSVEAAEYWYPSENTEKFWQFCWIHMWVFYKPWYNNCLLNRIMRRI